MVDIPDKSVNQKVEVLRQQAKKLRSQLQEGKKEDKESLKKELKNLEARVSYIDETSELENVATFESNDDQSQPMQNQQSEMAYDTNESEESDNEYGQEEITVSTPKDNVDKQIREAFKRDPYDTSYGTND